MKRTIWDQPERVGQWVCERLKWEFDVSRYTAIGLESEGELVAGVVYDKFNRRSIAMNIASVGSHWATRDFIDSILKYPFVQLGVQRLFGFIDSTNHQSKRFAEHLGMSLVSVIEGAGEVEDLCVYCMTDQKFKTRYL